MAEDFSDRTQTFSIETPQKLDMQQVLVQVYDALKEKGYNPISQIVGYILSCFRSFSTPFRAVIFIGREI